MVDMFDVPQELRSGPITRTAALAGGISRDVLEGRQFRRVHEAVYVHRTHQFTWRDAVAAARLALPPDARTTGITRLQELGLDYGPPHPVHFVVRGDLHLTLDGVFLHRTVKMPPGDEAGASAEAAYVAYCAEARTLDAIKVGCELLRQGLLDRHLLDQLLAEEKWRRGVAATRFVLPYLDDRCRSIPEAELLALVRFAGLPEPQVNLTIALAHGVLVTPDLWWAGYRRAAEYEGGQHQEDRGQYNSDIDRYALYRRHGADYVQITRERLCRPRIVARRVHALLAEGGYDGPSPAFDGLWPLLFRPLADAARRGHAA